MKDSKETLPLQGLRVVDLSRVLAGPLCAMMLGDLGAEVVKVERPGTGDETRGWGPPFAASGQSTYFQSANYNKLSIALDLTDSTDVTCLHALLDGADVVVENFLEGALARRGLDVPALLQRYPKLVWCTIGGFEATPGRPGYDAVVQAETGWMSITGAVDGEPAKVGVAVADVLTAKDAVAAILAALWARDRSDGSDRRLAVSLHRSAVAGLVNVAQGALATGVRPQRWGNAHASLVPYELFATADRPVMLAVGSDPQWRDCARILQLDDARVHGRWRTNSGRVEDRVELVELIAGAMRRRAAQEWLVAFAEAGVPAGLVKTVPEALAAAGADAQTGVPSGVGGRRRRPPPELDEHGAVLRRLGWGAFPVTGRGDRERSSVTT